MNDYSFRCMGLMLLLALPLLIIVLHRPPADEQGDGTVAEAAVPAEYTRKFRYVRADHTLLYGEEETLRTKPKLLPDATYKAVVHSMPIVCVDVLLTRGDGSALLVLRHAEPVRGMYWYPGGRLLMGESFGDAAQRKVRKEIGLSSTFCRVLGTYAALEPDLDEQINLHLICDSHVCTPRRNRWNTLFERSAWGAPTQTVNILVHATTDDEMAAAPRICGDQRGKCADGSHGRYKWVSPETSTGEDTYIIEGLAALRGARAAGGATCGE